MLLSSNTYNADWKRLVRWLIPSVLRKPVLLALLYAIIVPVMTIHNLFKKYREAKLYQLMITPQVCYMERMLNDRFDLTLRRIYISDAEWFAPIYLFQDAELKDLYLRQDVENAPLYLRTEDEAGDEQADFIVWVPTGLLFNTEEMKSLIDQYRLAGRRYKIQVV